MKKLRIAHIIDNSQLVINAGENDGITFGMKFLVYGISPKEIIDPSTKKSLGYLELVRGTAKPTYIQPTMCIVQAEAKQNIFATISGHEIEGVFNNAQVGDFVRIIQDNSI